LGYGLTGCGVRVDKGLKRLAESLDEFSGREERIPKLLMELDF
jgi:hypothetical protein